MSRHRGLGHSGLGRSAIDHSGFDGSFIHSVLNAALHSALFFKYTPANHPVSGFPLRRWISVQLGLRASRSSGAPLVNRPTGQRAN